MAPSLVQDEYGLRLKTKGKTQEEESGGKKTMIETREQSIKASESQNNN